MTTPEIPVMKPWFDEAEVDAATSVIRSGWVAQGPKVAEFEAAFASHVGASAGVAVTSCTTGLHLLLHALGLGPGDEVVVPSLSFIASANAPRYVGATPVFADVDPVTQNLTRETVEAVITARTRAVMVVHQVGMPADLDELGKLCEANDLLLIEDAACAVGSTYKGAPIGGGEALAVFSFHPRKILTTGEGGMITTPHAELAARLVRLRQHGMSVNAYARHKSDQVVLEQYLEMGFNFRMTDIQAAVGLAQLAKIDEVIARRRHLADQYRQALEDLPGLRLPADPPYGTTNYQSYSVVVTDEFGVDRDGVMSRLKDHGISSRRGIMAAHREPAFADFESAALPHTEYLTDHALILPLYHEMTDDDIARVADAIADARRTSG